MNTNDLTIYGGREDVSLITQLIEDCEEILELDLTPIAVYALCAPDEKNKIPESAKRVVLCHEDATLLPKETDRLTYSFSDSRADVSALNLQQRQSGTSFEILYGSHMGRVYIPKECKYSKDHILVAASVLCAWGVAIDKILSVINELIK